MHVVQQRVRTVSALFSQAMVGATSDNKVKLVVTEVGHTRRVLKGVTSLVMFAFKV